MMKPIAVLLALAGSGCGGSATLTESQEYYMARGVAALAIEKDHLWATRGSRSISPSWG